VFTPFHKPPYTYPSGRSVDETTTPTTEDIYRPLPSAAALSRGHPTLLISDPLAYETCRKLSADELLALSRGMLSSSELHPLSHGTLPADELPALSHGMLPADEIPFLSPLLPTVDEHIALPQGTLSDSEQWRRMV
jgi:hypothetical protein